MSNRAGWQFCENCGRDFLGKKGNWKCRYCSFDNTVGREIAAHAGMIATRRSSELASRKRLERKRGAQND